MVNEKGGGTTLARDSFEELRYIFDWSIANSNSRPGDIILIWGWVVHTYIPWKYSLDIDLIAIGRFRDQLRGHLYSTRDYHRERNSAGNTLYFKSLDSGEIYLDFLPKRDQFHGTGKSLNLMEIKYKTVPKNISYSFGSEFQVIVPEISMLLFLKLKAAWDRHYDLSLETTLDKNHLEEKFAKDYRDTIALLQSEAFKFARLDWLSSIISRFDFLRDFLEQGIVAYKSTSNRISHNERKALIKKLLSLI